jgi:hypothetical protein
MVGWRTAASTIAAQTSALNSPGQRVATTKTTVTNTNSAVPVARAANATVSKRKILIATTSRRRRPFQQADRRRRHPQSGGLDAEGLQANGTDAQAHERRVRGGACQHEGGGGDRQSLRPRGSPDHTGAEIGRLALGEAARPPWADRRLNGPARAWWRLSGFQRRASFTKRPAALSALAPAYPSVSSATSWLSRSHVSR